MIFEHKPHLLVGVLFCTALAFYASPALACGWWGDGELNQDADEAMVREPDAEHPGLQDALVPDGSGYGIAITQDGRALPYRRAIGENNPATITELMKTGFTTVVDLDSPAGASRLHRSETEAARMIYISLGITGAIPTPEQVRRFLHAANDPANRPLLVFSNSPDLLGIMWAIRQLNQGNPPGQAFGEGRALGLSREGENDLAWHLRNGRLKEFGGAFKAHP